MKYFLLLSCLLSVLSCADKNKLPPDVIPVNKMKIIVWELEIAEATASDKFLLQKDSLRMASTSLYQQVFANYKTDKKSFYNSFTFYEQHPDLMKVLFDSVTSYGNRKKNAAFKKMY